MSGLLEISDLSVTFSDRSGEARVLDGVNLTIAKGEAVAVVGESGSGKSMTALAVMGLLANQNGAKLEGSIRLGGIELTGLSERGLRQVRGAKMGMVFQDPMSSLNPVLTIGRQLAEHLQYHMRLNGRQARERSIELLAQVGIPQPAERIDNYPHQFSGGMRQRVMIAMAIACGPDLLIADEPTTALDVTVQSDIISLVMQLRAKSGMGVILITHDLASIAGLADRIAIMYAGRIVESAPTDVIFRHAAHPYARALLKAAPALTSQRRSRLVAIEGMPPDPAARPTGCAFADRCPYALDACRQIQPPYEALALSHDVACIRGRELLSRTEIHA